MLVAGWPGSGKSTLAAALAAELGLPLLAKDDIKEALMQGLKVIAERGMSKITKANIPDEAQRRDEIKAKALANVEDMYAGKIKITGAKAVKKASGAVMTEAMRLARNLALRAKRRQKQQPK